MFPEYVKRNPLDDNSVARGVRLCKGSGIEHPHQPVLRPPSHGHRVSSATGILPLSSDEQFMDPFQYLFGHSVHRYVSTFL